MLHEFGTHLRQWRSNESVDAKIYIFLSLLHEKDKEWSNPKKVPVAHFKRGCLGRSACLDKKARRKTSTSLLLKPGHYSPRTRVWEQHRRERLNTSFNSLSTLLPCYDPAANLSKVEILQKAANHIRELQQENKNLLAGTLDPSATKQVEQLKQRVADLLKRIQQLVDLLRDAGITVPPYPVDPKRQRWTNKFKQEDAQKLQDKNKKEIDQKSEAKKKRKKVNKLQVVRSNTIPLKTIMNNSSKIITINQINSNINTSDIPSIPGKKPKPSKKSKHQAKSVKSTTKLFGDKLPTVAQLLGLTMNDIETSPSLVESATISVHEASTIASPTLINTTAPLPPGFIVIQGNNNVQSSLTTTSVLNHNRPQQCIVMPTNTNTITGEKVTKSPTLSQQIPLVLSNYTSRKANKRKNNNVIAITKSHLLTAPVMASGIQTCPPPAVLTSPTPGLAGLGPGTLILANGNIVPVLPPPQTVLAPTQFIVNSNHLSTPANPPVIMMQQQKNTVTITTSSSGAPLVTSSVTKPQQRSFPVLVPKVSKKHKVPIPALTSKQQPFRSKQIQSPVVNNPVKSPNKTKSGSNSENIKPNSSITAGNKSSSESKKTTVDKGKEPTASENSGEKEKLTANENTILNEQGSNVIRVNITDEKLIESPSKKEKNNKEGLVNCEKDFQKEEVQQEESHKFDNTETTSSAKTNSECDKIFEKNEEKISVTCKRKKDSEKDEVCNKRKYVKHDTEKENSVSCKLSSDPVTSEQTSLTSSVTIKHSNSDTYTIDALFTNKPTHDNNSDNLTTLSVFSSNETATNSAFNDNHISPEDVVEDVCMKIQETEDQTVVNGTKENLSAKYAITIENSEANKNRPQKIDLNNSKKTDEIYNCLSATHCTISDKTTEMRSTDTSSTCTSVTDSQQFNITENMDQNVDNSQRQVNENSQKSSEHDQCIVIESSTEVNEPASITNQSSSNQQLNEIPEIPRQSFGEGHNLIKSPMITNISVEQDEQTVTVEDQQTSQKVKSPFVNTNSTLENQYMSQVIKSPVVMNEIIGDQQKSQLIGSYVVINSDPDDHCMSQLVNSPLTIISTKDDKQQTLQEGVSNADLEYENKTESSEKSNSQTVESHISSDYILDPQKSVVMASTTDNSSLADKHIPQENECSMDLNQDSEGDHTSKLLNVRSKVNEVLTNQCPPHITKSTFTKISTSEIQDRCQVTDIILTMNKNQNVCETQHDFNVKSYGNSVTLQHSQTIKENNDVTEKSILHSSLSSWNTNTESKEKIPNNNETFTSLPSVSTNACQVTTVSQRQEDETVKVINSENSKSLSSNNQHLSSSNLTLSSEDKSNINQMVSADIHLEKTLSFQNATGLYPSFTSASMMTHCNENSFIPITSSTELVTSLRTTENETNVNGSISISLQNHEFSNDLFASLQVPTSGQHSESISPTAAFLLAFPLVSSSKVTDMIVDAQEEVGSDSMQGTSTLLQIGNMEPDSVHCAHKALENSDTNEINRSKTQHKLTLSTQNDTANKNGGKITVQQNQQNGLSVSNKDRKVESSNSSSDSKKCPVNVTDFSSTSGKQWPNASNIQQSDKVNAKSRSVGTQSQIANNFTLKSTEVTCVQNTLPPTVQPCSSVTGNTYISVESNKGNTNQCFANQMKQVTSSNQIPSQQTQIINTYKSSSQQIHPSRNVYQSLPTFEPPVHNNVSQGDNSKKLSSTSEKFSNSVTHSTESSCLKPQSPITSQRGRTHTDILQTFHANKKTQQNCQDIMTEVRISENSIGNHPPSQYSFSKIHASEIMNEAGTMTEETRNVSVNYKLLPPTSSTSDTMKYIFPNPVSAPVNSNRAISYSHMPPNSVPEQPYSCSLFTNEYSTIPSQITCSPTYTQASNPNDQIKTTGVGSFSVAHNSSNFSILSWTTLSPMSAPTNTNQYDSFHMPPQNSSTNVSHHTTAVTSLQKTVSQTDISPPGAVTMAVPPATEMQEVESNCQKQCKNDRNIEKSTNDGICKLSGNFHGLYNNDEQRSLEMQHQTISTSHMQFHRTNNDNQTIGSPEEGGGNNENFKYPISSTSGTKNHQSSRANHSVERIKSGQLHRPPVNWMTSPDIRTSTSVMNSTSTSIGQPTMSTTVSSVNSESTSTHVNKEFEFCNISNPNIFVNSSNTSHSAFDSRNFASNTALYAGHVLPSHSNLYSNNQQSSHLSCSKEETVHHGRNMHHNSTHQRLPDMSVSGQNYQNEAYSLPWTGRKVSTSRIQSEINSSNFVPSTLPTLVGDLALGTNYPISGNDDNHNKSFMQSNYDSSEINKKNLSIETLEERRQEISGKQISNRHTEKESVINTVTIGSKIRNGNTSINNGRVCTQDYHGPTHAEVSSSGVSTSTSGNFLSVSQLVDQVKSANGSTRTQVNSSSRRNSNNRQASNKSSGTQTRQHTTNMSSSTKRSSAVQNSSERENNKKQQQAVSFSVGEGTSTMSVSRENRKPTETNRDNHYSNDNASTIIPPISQGNGGFSMPIHDRGGHPAIASNHHNWIPNRGKPTRSNSSSYKAPVSNYSAEALIGLSNNNNTDSTHLSQEPTNKVITLPPPVVSERFSHSQSYHHPQSARALQVPSSFGNESVIPGNYFAPVDLPSHHTDGNGSGIHSSSHHDNFTQTTHQNQQSYSNTSFSYPAGTSNMSGQSPATLYPPTNFVANTNSGHPNVSIPPVTLPAGFLSDLSSNNSFTGGIIPSDANNSLIFPPSIMKTVTTNRSNGNSNRHNTTYLHPSTSSSTQHHHQQLPSRNDTTSGEVTEANRSVAPNVSSNDGNRRPSIHAGGLQLHHQTSNLSNSNNHTNCSLSKRGNGSRRRIPDPIPSTSASSSGITGFVDLGYLPMPPGIGSPMLGADDGTFLSHHASGTFLAPPGPQIYAAGPAPTPQGTLYPPPPQNNHSSNHLPPFSSCAPVQQNASQPRASHHQQQQQANTSPNATNTSSNTLANFNLSTIFPEINDKQVPTVPSVVGFPSGSKSLTSAGPSLLPPANSTHHHPTLLPPASSNAEYPHRVVPPPVSVSNNCLPPPPVPLHTNFNNLLSHAPPQVGRMQWP